MKIIKLSAIDSTNSYLRALSRDIAVPDATVVVANHQTAGRGQRLSSWRSICGESLTFSIYKRFSTLSPHRQFELLMAVSLGLKDALEDLGIPGISIKWPNDILSRSKKICGILIENTLSGNILTASIIGVGLNVNETDFAPLPQATSMRLAAGKTFDRDEVLKRVCAIILTEVAKLERQKGTLRYRYEEALFGNNRECAFQYPQGAQFKGTIRGVSENGELLVETDSSEVKRFQFKEVKLLY